MAFNLDPAYLPLKDMTSQKSDSYESSLGSSEHKAPPFQLHDKKRKFKYWAWEWMALVVSLVAVIISGVILVTLDSKPIPMWSWQSNGISVNSILSLLSTLSRASLLVPIDECMGQLMWLRYARREQRVSEVLHYNEAARGPLGAIKMIWRQRGITLGCLGSLLLVGSLGIGTAQQQLLSYPSQLFVNPEILSNVTRAENFNSYQNISTSDGSTPIMSFSLLSSIYSAALTSPSDHIVAKEVLPSFVCTSGTCTFPDLTTLAICSECRDTTSEVQSTCTSDDSSCTATFQGLTASSWRVNTPTNINTILNQTSTNSTSGFTTKSPFATTAHLQASISTWPPSYTGTQCALYWCAKTVSASVTNGTYTEKVISTHDEYTTDSTGAITIAGEHLNSTFHVSPAAQSSVAGQNGVTATLKGWAKSAPSGTERVFSSDLMQGFSNYDDVSVVMGRIASGMTNRIRDLDSATPAVAGETWSKRAFIRVRWAWMLYPITLWVLSLIFLVCIAVQARDGERRWGMRVWGANPIALLFHGLDDETRGRVREGEWEQLSDLAERLWVKLEPGQGGMRLRGRKVDN